MSETQSEHYTTPEFAASLSLPGGGASLGASPLGEHVTALNDPGRRMDSRTLQVRMNDDVAIRHVERIEAPLVCTHRRFDDDSSGEERMRRRRRRRRREHRRRNYVDDVNSDILEEDLRRRRRGGRRNDEFSDSAESELRKRRRKRRDDEFSDDWDSEIERRNRRRWSRRADRSASSERSDEEEEDMVDDASDSNWVRNKKRRGEKMEKSQRRSRSKEESANEDSETEYVRVKRTTIKSKKTKRKTVTDEEQERHVEESSERGSEVEVEEEVEEDLEKENSEITSKASKSEKVTTTTTKAKTKRKDDKGKSKEDSNIVHKVDSQRSKKKEAAVEKDARKKQETSSNKKTESESKRLEGSKAKISKKFVTKESSTRKTTEETKDNDSTKRSTKKVMRKGVKQVEAAGKPKVVDKVVEKITMEETGKESLQKREAYRQSQAPMSLEEDGATQRVVTALVHQHGDEGSSEVPCGDEQMESTERLEGGQQSGSDTVQNTGSVGGQLIADGARKSSKQEEQTDVGGGGGTEVADLETVEGNESEEKKDDMEGGISKNADIESSKMRTAGEGEGDITIDGEAETKTEETHGDNEKEAESVVEREGKAIYEDEEGEVKSREIGDELDACGSERKEVEEEGERRTEEEEEEEGKLGEEGERKEFEAEGDVSKEMNDVAEEERNADPKYSKPAAKDVSEYAETKGPQADKETQELKRDVKGDEEAEERDKRDEDSRSSTRDLTISSPLEKEEGAEREVNGESEISTARSRNGGDSSVLLDSGFEPSPRRDKDTTTTSSNNQQTRSARGSRGPSRGRGRGRIPRPCRTDDEQPVTTVSVTQAVQRSMRKYHLERRIFQELLELKRLQIRAGRANEQVLVKRLVDDYHKAGLTVGVRQYDGVYTFRSFEKYLYDQLRLLQSSDRRLIPRLKSSDDLEKLTAALRRARFNSTYLDDIPDNPILCTHGTHRCHHAAHAYTGIPCAAYVMKTHHHHAPKSGHAGSSRSGFLPRIDPNSRGAGRNSSAIPRSLSYVDPSRPVTLELSHGSDKQVISLPTERLDRNKRYYVTFTIKGGPNGSKEDKEAESSERRADVRHRHSESL